MSRQCLVCCHPEREAIDALLIRGEAYRSVAKQFECGEASMYRHKRNCIKATIEVVQTEKKVQAAARNEAFVWNLLTEMQWLHDEGWGIYREARAEKDNASSLKALGELRQQAKLFSELLSGQEQGTQKAREQEWVNLREIIFAALEPYPEARVAVARALLALEKRDDDQPSQQLG